MGKMVSTIITVIVVGAITSSAGNAQSRAPKNGVCPPGTVVYNVGRLQTCGATATTSQWAN